MEVLEKNGFVRRLFPKITKSFDEAKDFASRVQKGEGKMFSEDLNKPNFFKRHNPFNAEMRTKNKSEYKDLRDHQSELNESVKSYKKNTGFFERRKDPLYQGMVNRKKKLDKDFGKSYKTTGERTGDFLKLNVPTTAVGGGIIGVNSKLNEPTYDKKEHLRALKSKYN